MKPEAAPLSSQQLSEEARTESGTLTDTPGAAPEFRPPQSPTPVFPQPDKPSCDRLSEKASSEPGWQRPQVSARWTTPLGPAVPQTAGPEAAARQASAGCPQGTCPQAAPCMVCPAAYLPSAATARSAYKSLPEKAPQAAHRL